MTRRLPFLLSTDLSPSAIATGQAASTSFEAIPLSQVSSAEHYSIIGSVTAGEAVCNDAVPLVASTCQELLNLAVQACAEGGAKYEIRETIQFNSL